MLFILNWGLMLLSCIFCIIFHFVYSFVKVCNEIIKLFLPLQINLIISEKIMSPEGKRLHYKMQQQLSLEKRLYFVCNSRTFGSPFHLEISLGSITNADKCVIPSFFKLIINKNFIHK